MKAGVTSKEEIMQVCRRIVSEQGLSAVNMRAVASACHIALGTLYNYYSDKDELVLGGVESVWMDIFHMDQSCKIRDSFGEYVRELYERVLEGIKAYPNFFTAHSVGIANAEKGRARSMMEHYFSHMKAGMQKALEADHKVRADAFSGEFTKENFVGFVLENMLLLLMQGRGDCGVLIEMIRRGIY